MADTKTVLLVDDSPTVLKLLTKFLEEQDFTILVAENGAEGLKIAREVVPDVIVSDVIMPQMNGYEMLFHLRGERATKFIPFIFLTSRTEASEEAMGLQLGADYYLTKPVKRAVLLDRIRKIFHLQDKAKEIQRRKASGFQGSLADLRVGDIFQVLELSRRTGRLHLESNMTGAYVDVREGQPCQATILGQEDLPDKQAVFRLLEWTSGTFHFDGDFSPQMAQIKAPLSTLLLQWAVRRDHEDAGAELDPESTDGLDPHEILTITQRLEMHIEETSIFANSRKVIAKYLRMDYGAKIMAFLKGGQRAVVMFSRTPNEEEFFKRTLAFYARTMAAEANLKDHRRIVFSGRHGHIVCCRLEKQGTLHLVAMVSEMRPGLEEYLHELAAAVAEKLPDVS